MFYSIVLRSIEEFPCEAEIETKLVGGVVGQEVVAMGLQKAVEVPCLGVDAGTFHLKVDEELNLV